MVFCISQSPDVPYHQLIRQTKALSNGGSLIAIKQESLGIDAVRKDGEAI